MIYDYTRPTLREADKLALEGKIDEMYRALRSLPMADFCEVFWTPPAEFPNLSAALPSMPSDEMQRRWTGHAGRDLLVKSCSQLRLYQDSSLTLRQREIKGPLLDYGSGWGRMSRMMAYFAETKLIYGVDPMEDSLNACAHHRVAGNFHKIDTIPKSFPIAGVKFDFAMSYSVMTHTPEKVSRAILRSVRSVIADDGLFICTIRPIEFWEMRKSNMSEGKAEKMILDHQNTGYAFTPIMGGVELTEEVYGDSSYSLEYFGKMAQACEWKVSKIDRDVLEPWQISIVLEPRL